MHGLNWNVKQALKNLHTIGILSNKDSWCFSSNASCVRPQSFSVLATISYTYLGKEWRAYCCIAKQETYDVYNTNSMWIFPFSEFYQMFKEITAFRSLLWIGVEDLLSEINEENN